MVPISPTCVGESETLIIYKPETREFEKRHWTECFGAENIYGRFFDNLTTQTWMREGFRKFDVLKRVDREIFNGLVDPIWQIHQLQPSGNISLRRDDVYSLRKFLFLMTSLHGRDRTMHLMAHDPNMEDARIRRKRFIEAHSMEHPRDVWLNNAEQVLNTQHWEVHNNFSIFDLDREDYRANARERFLVFWEAGPGDEFILTENGFGGFEGGQIGAKKNITINMKAREHEQHIYTKDFMWHQLYVLSPTLVAALCHGTLMHPELTRAQRKRWGLRRSLLETLPHEVAPKYYKDMARQDASFLKPGWTLPAEVERAFGTNVAPERRGADELEFPVQRLSPKQVAMVNSVLLHNQQSGAMVKSVCCRSPPQYQSLYNSLIQFHHNPWDKYSEEDQNDYAPLTERLRVFLEPQAPLEPLVHMQYAQQMQQPQQFGHHMPSHQIHPIPVPIPQPMSDPRRIFTDNRSMAMPEVPRYEPIHVDMRPAHLRANSQMSHSSHTSSFTPSSQSSQTYSSASSQTSSSRATSIDTPRFEPKEIVREPKSRHQSPTRRNEKPLSQRNGNSQTESVPSRASDGSGKSKIDKARSEKQPQASKGANIVIEHVVQEIQERHRGRQLDPARNEKPAQKKVSPQPQPDRVELVAPAPKPRQQEPVKIQPKPQPQQQQLKPSSLPERPMYVMDVMDPMRPVQPERQRSDQPQQQWGFNPVEIQGHQYEMGLPEQQAHSQQSQKSANQSNERQSQSSEHVRQRQYEVAMQEQQCHPPQRNTNQTTERTSQTSETARRQQQYENPRPELGQVQRPINPPSDRHSADTTSSRGRPYEPPRTEQGQVQRPVQRSNERQQQPAADSGRAHQNEQQPQQMRNTNSHERSSHGSEHVRPRQYEFELLKPEQSKPQPSTHAPKPPPHKPQPQIQIQKPQPQRPNGLANETVTSPVEEPRGRQYEVVTPEGLQPQPQRSANSSSERQMRPGVEIVRPHALEPVRPEPRSTLQPPAQKSTAQTSQPERPQYSNGMLENAKIKQLRFDAKTLTHKLSNMSLDGSMIVETGDKDDESEGGSEDEEEEEEEEDDDDDDESWEDEGFAESEELSKPRKPTVRFADRPLSRTGGRVPVHIERPLSRLGFGLGLAHLGRKVDFIERPSSRLGRRVEIARPLSRNSQRLVAGKVKHAHGHGNIHAHR